LSPGHSSGTFSDSAGIFQTPNGWDSDIWPLSDFNCHYRFNQNYRSILRKDDLYEEKI